MNYIDLFCMYLFGVATVFAYLELKICQENLMLVFHEKTNRAY